MQIFLYLIASSTSAIGAAVVGYLWSWSWFGDIWHSNTISNLWFIPVGTIMMMNILFITFSPHFIEGWHFSWWHYAVLLAGWGVGIAALIPFITK